MSVILLDILTQAGHHWRNCAEEVEKALDIDLGLLDDGPPRPWNTISLGSPWDQATEDIRQSVLRDSLDEERRRAFDQYVEHPIHRIISRLNKLSDIRLADLTMFAWRAPLPDGLHSQPCFPQDLTGLVARLKLLDQDGTTDIIVREFASELIELGILDPPEERRFGF